METETEMFLTAALDRWNLSTKKRKAASDHAVLNTSVLHRIVLFHTEKTLPSIYTDLITSQLSWWPMKLFERVQFLSNAVNAITLQSSLVHFYD